MCTLLLSLFIVGGVEIAPEVSVTTETIAAVSGSVSEVNTLVGDSQLDPTGDANAEILEAAQTTLQSSVEELAAGTVDVAAFETATESKTLFEGSTVLEALPDADDDGLADAVDLDDDADGVDDDCWGNSPGLYIYHDEDLIASNKHYHSEDLFCPVDSEDQDYSNCSYAMLEVDLVAGDYTIYTTFDSEASYYNNIDGAYVVVDGEESDDWDGHMRDNYWDWDEEAEEEVLVEGTASRDYFPQADYHDYEYEPECYDEDGNMIDCDDVFEMFVYMFMIAENATHYEAGNLTAVEAADNSVELFYMLVDAGMFERGEDDHDHHGQQDGRKEIQRNSCTNRETHD